MKYFILSILGLVFIASCKPTKEKADYLITAAKIYTVDSTNRQVEALAIKEGRIIAIGSKAELLKRFDADSLISYPDAFIYPGFIDAHCHFLAYGKIKSRYVDLTGTQSFEEVLEKLQEFHKNNPESSWILGRGWDQNDWKVKSFPKRTKLDSLFPDKYVLLTRIDGHAVLANGALLQKAGFTPETQIAGGELIIDQGKLSGILLDNAADSLKNMVPELSLNEKQKALQQAQSDCFGVGLTSVVDAGLHADDISF